VVRSPSYSVFISLQRPGPDRRLRKASDQPSGHSQITESSGSTPESCPELSDEDGDFVPGEPSRDQTKLHLRGARGPDLTRKARRKCLLLPPAPLQDGKAEKHLPGMCLLCPLCPDVFLWVLPSQRDSPGGDEGCSQG
jgi:hypothetical protein